MPYMEISSKTPISRPITLDILASLKVISQIVLVIAIITVGMPVGAMACEKVGLTSHTYSQEDVKKFMEMNFKTGYSDGQYFQLKSQLDYVNSRNGYLEDQITDLKAKNIALDEKLNKYVNLLEHPPYISFEDMNGLLKSAGEKEITDSQYGLIKKHIQGGNKITKA